MNRTKEQISIIINIFATTALESSTRRIKMYIRCCLQIISLVKQKLVCHEDLKTSMPYYE